MVHGGNLSHSSVLIDNTLRAIDEFQVIHEKREELPNDTVQHDIVRWRAPSTGWVKANWDAALNSLNGRTDFGVVVRDSNGTMIMA